MELKQVLVSSGVCMLMGLGLFMFAWQEWRVSADTSKAPLAVDLGKLESAPSSENNHLQIGPHSACYFATVYSYKTKRRDRRKRPDADTSVSYCYYPIISSTHPYVQEIEKLETQYGSLDQVPDEVAFPPMPSFSVLVKTKRFKTIGAIPDESLRAEPGVQGLVINRISSLSSEEQKLIKDDFPDIDFNKVLILEDGRTPSSGLFSICLVFAGLPFVLLGIWLIGLGILSRVRPGA
jgi:hypothetical protein